MVLGTYTPLAQWLWDTTGSVPIVSGYPQASGYAPTKTGLTSGDVQNFVGLPLMNYSGSTPVALASGLVQDWIRSVEDKVEAETSILLCQTWVASPPAVQTGFSRTIGQITASGYQRQGYEYDIADAAYDFFFPRAQDEGWMVQDLRFRPVQSLTYTPTDFSAVKGISYVYPLLNQFFRVPNTWMVEDHDFGLVRLVPSANVQMLPLFAMQLAFMGFAESVPGACWYQYTAGLTPFDYQGRWRFMKQLVLAGTAILALRAIQGGVNMGLQSVQTLVDGLQYRSEYDKRGPYGPLIEQNMNTWKELLQTAQSRVQGPVIGFL